MPNVLPFAVHAGPRSLASRSSRDAGACLEVVCETPWGSYALRVDGPAHATLRDVLENVHRRVIVDLELVAEGVELPASRCKFGPASLLLTPQLYLTNAEALVRGGAQSAARRVRPTEDKAVLRIEGRGPAESVEFMLDAAHLTRLRAALLGSGSRTSVEACLVGALVSVLEAEWSRVAAEQVRSA